MTIPTKLQKNKIIVVLSAVFSLSACNYGTSNKDVINSALDNQQNNAVEQTKNKSTLLDNNVSTSEQLITVSPIHDENKFDGWGTSLAWWGQSHGNQSHDTVFSQLLYSMKDQISYVNFGSADNINLTSSMLPGLGFNIMRYNLGGGDIDNNNVFYYGTILDRNRWVNGFWVNKDDRNPDSWAWDNDPNQLRMLKLSYSEVKNSDVSPIVEMFSNSPMWWMTENNSTQGVGTFNPVSRADDCIDMKNNKMLNDFGYYLAKSAEHFQKYFGIKVDYVEPFNEPNNGWWAQNKTFGFGENTQEGCNMWELDSKKTVIASVRQALDTDNNTNIKIAAADYNQMNQFFREYPYLKGTIDKVNLHSYDGAGPYEGRSRRQLHDIVVGLKGDDRHSDIKLWQSEFGGAEQSA